MRRFVGFDVGGTKIAAAAYQEDGLLLGQLQQPTPQDYDSFIRLCAEMAGVLCQEHKPDGAFGMGIAGLVDARCGQSKASNMPFINDHNLRDDLEKATGCSVRLANDANCMALAEAVDGAGAGASSVLGLIIGTGVGSGFILNGQIVDGPHGLAGEIGHLPLPLREEADGPVTTCGCWQIGCIETFISGPALSRLYMFMVGQQAQPPEIAEKAKAGDGAAQAVMDCYYEIVAKAMIVPLYAYDPEIIVISGGLSALEGLYTDMPKRISKYSFIKEIKTRFKPAVHGPMAGLRGAAYLWR